MVTIPTITQIRDQIISDIESKIGTSVPILPKAFIRVLASALAGVVALLYRYGLSIYRQIFPQTQEEDSLIKFADQFGIYRIPAVRARLEVEITGENETVIPAGTLWVNSDGIAYSQEEDVEIDYGSTIAVLECLTSGDIGNLADGAELTIVTPLAGVDGIATVIDTETEGVDQEDIDDFRSRVLSWLRNRPQGGAAPDYVVWAREVPGIAKAFAYCTDPGEVTVYPLISLTDDRLPDAQKIAEVLAYLEDTHRRPLCATVLVVAMTERVFSLEVTGLQPDTAAVRANIETAVEQYLWSCFPKQYPDEITPTDIVSLAAVYSAAFRAGATQITIELYIDGNYDPIAGHQLADNELAKLGEITWPS